MNDNLELINAAFIKLDLFPSPAFLPMTGLIACSIVREKTMSCPDT